MHPSVSDNREHPSNVMGASKVYTGFSNEEPDQANGENVPTIQQLVRKGRTPKVVKTKAPALKGNP